MGNASALNSFRHFARFMNPAYEPLPSSVIAEGDDIWNGAGDRGDAAMIACGAARYALARGDRAEAAELWPLVEWCLEYCRRQLTADGVVASDTDELEGRFPTGDANLCTSTLYYDALLSAVSLGRELGVESAQTARYAAQARALARAIDAHFGGEVGGYDTYRYYAGNTLLRSWICMPLIVGLKERSEGTVRALLGPELMTDDGLLTQQGSSTFWDRSTLYALRGSTTWGRPTVRPNCCTAIRSGACWATMCLIPSRRGPKARSATFRPRAGSTAASSPRACSASAPRGCGRSTSRLPCPLPGRACPCAISGRSAPISTSRSRAWRTAGSALRWPGPAQNRKYTARHPARRYR